MKRTLMKKLIMLNLVLIMGIIVFHPANVWSFGDRANDMVIELESSSGWQMNPIDQGYLRNVGSFCMQETPLRIRCEQLARGALLSHVAFTKSSGSPPQKITAVYEIAHHGCRGSVHKLPSGIELPSSDCKCVPPTIQHSSGNGSLGYSVEPCFKDKFANEKPLRVIFK